MTEMGKRILMVLERYISPINARVMFMRAAQAAKTDPSHIGATEAAEIVDAIKRSTQLFVAGTAQERLFADLSALVAPTKVPSAVVGIGDENDLSRARLVARGMCTEIRAAPYALQKIATAVSELARNIVKYASGPGKIELSVDETPPRRFVIVATDFGPGITNLDAILAGRHKSKTGMGLGLVGTKKLADRFDIKTGSSGTRVVAEFVL